MDRGDMGNNSTIHMGIHTGTHEDAPRHDIIDGKTIDKMPLSDAIGPARVIEINDREAIKAKELTSYQFEGASVSSLKLKIPTGAGKQLISCRILFTSPPMQRKTWPIRELNWSASIIFRSADRRRRIKYFSTPASGYWKGQTFPP